MQRPGSTSEHELVTSRPRRGSRAPRSQRRTAATTWLSMSTSFAARTVTRVPAKPFTGSIDPEAIVEPRDARVPGTRVTERTRPTNATCDPSSFSFTDSVEPTVRCPRRRAGARAQDAPMSANVSERLKPRRAARRPDRRQSRSRRHRARPRFAQLVHERADDAPPDAPMGCPSATAPPLTLTISSSTPSIRVEFFATEANASLISTRARSSIAFPPSRAPPQQRSQECARDRRSRPRRSRSRGSSPTARDRGAPRTPPSRRRRRTRHR